MMMMMKFERVDDVRCFKVCCVRASNFTEEEDSFFVWRKKKEKKFFIVHSKKHFFAPQ